MRLGIDLGSNSLGWCLYEGDAIKDIGVRIFSDGREASRMDIPGSGTSLAVTRREARSARRRRDRYLGRRAAMLQALRKHKLFPDDIDEAAALERLDPYVLRVASLDARIRPFEIGRALFHLNQRRGFKSNRKADRKADDKESGKIAEGTKALDDAMAALKARTYAEYLIKREALEPDSVGKRVRMRPDDGKYDFYPDRRHILDEFRKIWEHQKPFHPDLLTDDAWKDIFRVIEFQRPLKAQVVGKCTFAGFKGVPDDEKRLPKSHPLFQQRRLYEEVNQLEIFSPGQPSRKLSLDERNLLILKLRDKKKVTFSSLAKTLKLDQHQRFNKESDNRKDLLGDEVRAALSSEKCFGPKWAGFSDADQWRIIQKLLSEEDTQRLLQWLIKTYGVDEEIALNIANAPLPDGHGRFGEKATRMLLEELKSDVVTYAKAAEQAGFNHSDMSTGEVLDNLPYYGAVLTREIAPGKEEYGNEDERRFGKITNPTVHIGMNQLRRVVNAVIKKHGKPDQIYIELARELKMNEKQKAAYNRQLKQNMDDAQDRSGKLLEMGLRDSGSNRMLLKLWAQLNPSNAMDRRCPYCGEPITPGMIKTGEVDIDHIIPYSLCLDDGIGNKVLAHTKCNRQKGQKAPYDKWGGTDRWPVIQEQAGKLHRSKQWRFGPEAMDRVKNDGGFIARQLTDTQYLSRLAGKYLSALYPERSTRHVYAVPGRMTAMLRRLWGLNDVLSDHNWVSNEHSNAPKNRLDHRHHSIDAAVVAATTPSLISEIAKAAGRAEAMELDKLFVELPQPWDGFRDDLRQKVNDVVVSHKADHGRQGKPSPDKDVTAGKLHNDTAYGLTGEFSESGVPIVVTRKSLLSLKPKDLKDQGRMTDRDLQSALYQATENLSGKPFENALKTFSRASGPYKGIRRVRLREPLNVIPISDKSGRPYKGVKGDGNALFVVWSLPSGKWVTQWTDREGLKQSSVISTFDLHQPGFQQVRPHPAAKKVLALRRGDLLAIERVCNSVEIVRVVKFDKKGTIVLAAHHEAGSLKARDEDKFADPFKYLNSSANGLKKLDARQVRIDELGAVFDPGPLV